MNAALFQDHSATSTLTLTPEEAEALAFLLPLSSDYPDINRWYCEKVVPGLRTGSRKLVRIVREDTLVGLGIGKIEPQERKICTVRVAPSHAGKGIGVRIFDHLLRWLDVDQPHLTISDTKLPLFERIFDYFGFANTSAQPGYYMPERCEFGFNEPKWGKLARPAYSLPLVEPLPGPAPTLQMPQSLPMVSAMSGRNQKPLPALR